MCSTRFSDKCIPKLRRNCTKITKSLRKITEKITKIRNPVYKIPSPLPSQAIAFSGSWSCWLFDERNMAVISCEPHVVCFVLASCCILESCCIFVLETRCILELCCTFPVTLLARHLVTWRWIWPCRIPDHMPRACKWTSNQF